MTTDKTTQEIIEEQIQKLPKDVREAIISVDYNKKLEEIVKRQKILIDQAAKLETETSLVMIGLEPISSYINNLKDNLDLTSERAAEIARDVNETIFKPIRNSLQNIGENIGGESAEQTVPDVVTEKEIVIKSTTSNDPNLNRDQILNEIENPTSISGGDRTMKFVSQKPAVPPPVVKVETKEIEIKPTQEVEIIPGEPVKDVIKEKETPQIMTNILESKMSGSTITSQQIVDIKPEIKLPEVEKKRPSSGVDPYREPVI
jgi:hypothetical protein